MPQNNKEIIINLKNLTKRFGSFTAVSNLNLDIRKGEIIGLLGPNGAGKTTTMKMIARLLNPDEGEVWIKDNGSLELLTGRNMVTLLDHIGFLIENPAFYEHMSPRKILTYFGILKGYPKKQLPERIEEVLKLVGLSDWIDKKVGTFSKGMKQKLGIVTALIHNPDILILDEPQTGLDPKARKEIRQLLVKLRKQGKTIFLSSHLLYEVSEISDRIAIINNGKLIAFDSMKNLEAASGEAKLKIKLLELPVDIEKKRVELEEIILPHTGLKLKSRVVSFDPELEVFEARFDGELTNQRKILEELTKKEIDIVDFSVPRTNALEDLYIQLIAGVTIDEFTESQAISVENGGI
ncbi:MAG: ABC transporter ATP-binding protein [Candidatus Heimdallarchaeota archaeon]|nr:ABC transporter ATP-binding protein [Candidatus Heimdallarchaeota archaeon]